MGSNIEWGNYSVNTDLQEAQKIAFFLDVSLLKDII